MRPMRPSGSRRAVPTAHCPARRARRRGRCASSHSSHSSSRGTACSSMNTRSRTGRASGRRFAPGRDPDRERRAAWRLYNPTDAELVEGRGGEAVQRRPGAARLYLAAARPRQVPGAARRRQHLGQDRARKTSSARRRPSSTSRAAAGTWRRSSRKVSPGAPRARAAAGGAALALRPRDGQPARHPHAQGLGAGAVDRDHPARPDAAEVRRPHPRRRGALGDQHAGWREAHPRDLRQALRGDSVPHTGVRSRAVLRQGVPRAGTHGHRRHGAAQPRHLFLRRNRPRVLRAR